MGRLLELSNKKPILFRKPGETMAKQLTPYLKAKLEYVYTPESDFVKIVEEYLLTKEHEEMLSKYNLTVDAVLHMPAKEIPAEIKDVVFADWNNQVGLKLFYLD
jgi:hypothetical protein